MLETIKTAEPPRDAEIERGLARFIPHPDRGTVLAEVHARPFRPVTVPARLLHFAFATDSAGAERDRAALVRFCSERGAAPPLSGAKQHVAVLGDTSLRWEQHGEFTTYTWDVSREAASAQGPFAPSSAALAHPMAQLPQPGPHLVSIDLHILPEAAAGDPTRPFDLSSLCHSLIDDAGATLATDLKPGADGFVRFLVSMRHDDPARTGALAQRILELETYRTLALLGLPEAQRLGPAVRAIEKELAAITAEMTRSVGLEANRTLLDLLTGIAAKLEADAASSLFRFGATTAYNDIMRARLQVLGEQEIEGRSSLDEFLSGRHGPAMRFCASIVDRQANLSRKLARAVQLLRSRVEVEIEQQNSELLTAMNERTQLQLRLQQTVEGFSVVAISYYLIGLVAYIAKAAADVGWTGAPGVITAIMVPIVLASVWFVVRGARKALKLPGD
jgi:uncharacterized membrane-anchored protein